MRCEEIGCGGFRRFFSECGMYLADAAAGCVERVRRATGSLPQSHDLSNEEAPLTGRARSVAGKTTRVLTAVGGGVTTFVLSRLSPAESTIVSLGLGASVQTMVEAVLSKGHSRQWARLNSLSALPIFFTLSQVVLNTEDEEAQRYLGAVIAALLGTWLVQETRHRVFQPTVAEFGDGPAHRPPMHLCRALEPHWSWPFGYLQLLKGAGGGALLALRGGEPLPDMIGLLLLGHALGSTVQLPLTRAIEGLEATAAKEADPLSGPPLLVRTAIVGERAIYALSNSGWVALLAFLPESLTARLAAGMMWGAAGSRVNDRFLRGRLEIASLSPVGKVITAIWALGAVPTWAIYSMTQIDGDPILTAALASCLVGSLIGRALHGAAQRHPLLALYTGPRREVLALPLVILNLCQKLGDRNLHSFWVAVPAYGSLGFLLGAPELGIGDAGLKILGISWAVQTSLDQGSP
jgi:hypothetical protein